MTLVIQEMANYGPLHMSPVEQTGLLTGTNFALGSYKTF